jgi:hypothetical protein
MRAKFTFSRIATALLASGMALSNAHAALRPCGFSFGAGWNGLTANYPASIDFVTIWAGSDEAWNTYWIGDMLKACKPGGKLAGKTPVYYSYIIAFTARRDLGLLDCNVGSPNLCQKGANFIRQKKDRILAQYAKYASETAKAWGTTEPIVWLMEPDYFQYAGDTRQEGGPITYAEAGNFMKELVAKVRESLPNAVFSMDISPWVPDAAKWYASFKMDDFTYINTSGGETDANNTRIRAANSMTWKSVRDVTNKPIIADDGYGVAGSSTYHDATWDEVGNLNARIADGVVAISQTNPKSDWNSTITSVRGQLNPKACPVGLLPRVSAPPRGFATINWDALGRPVSLNRMPLRK